MYRAKRKVNVFSMSALDLFASAMGAFIIICVILFPDYLKTREALAKSAVLDSEIAEVEEEIDRYKDEIQRAHVTVTLEEVREKREQSEERLEITSEQVRKLEDKVRNSVKFVLLGLDTQTKSLTMVIDLSGSMMEYRRLMLELCNRIINALTEEHSLAIIGFRIVGVEPDIYVWPEARRPAAMDAAGRLAAAAYVEELSNLFDGGTPTYDALVAALETDAETIILITDGIPSFPVGLRAREIVDVVTDANVNRRQIHAVGIGEFNANPVFLDFLQNLADRNEGEFASYAR